MFFIKITFILIKCFFSSIKFVFNKLSDILKKKTPSIKRLNDLYKLQKRSPSKAGFEFEKLMRDHLIKIGFKASLAMDNKKLGKYPKEFLKKGFDGGLDVIAEDKNRVIIIQTKFYSKKRKVDGADIGKTSNMATVYQKYLNEIGDKRRLVVMVVTNTGFDSTSIIHAKNNNVILMDGVQLVRYLSNESPAKKTQKKISSDKKSLPVLARRNQIVMN